jgi:hypothetical protein
MSVPQAKPSPLWGGSTADAERQAAGVGSLLAYAEIPNALTLTPLASLAILPTKERVRPRPRQAFTMHWLAAKRASPARRWPSLDQSILVNRAVFHDDQKILVRIGDELDVLQRIAVDEQQVGERTFLHNAQSAGIWIAETG